MCTPARNAFRIALLTLALALPSAGRAQMIEIQFDLTGSTVTSAGGLVSLPPDGSVAAGAGTLEVVGSDLVSPFPGPATFRDFTLDLTFDGSPLGTTLTGTFIADQDGTASGMLSAALDQFTFGESLLTTTAGALDCVGALCGALGSFPLPFGGPEASDPPLALSLQGLTVEGGAQLAGSVPISVGGEPATLILAGNETGRVLLPEPSRFAQLAAGAVCLALLARLRRAG